MFWPLVVFPRPDTLEPSQQSPTAVFDPVSSLDPKLSRVVLDILLRICREDGITTVVSLHTLDLTREYADRIIGLKHGRIFFDGAVKELTDAIVNSVYHRNGADD